MENVDILKLLEKLRARYYEEQRKKHARYGAFNEKISEVLENAIENVLRDLGYGVERNYPFSYGGLRVKVDIYARTHGKHIAVECKAMPKGIIFKPDVLKIFLEALILQELASNSCPYILVSAYNKFRGRSIRRLIEFISTRILVLRCEDSVEHAYKTLVDSFSNIDEIYDDWYRARERLAKFVEILSELRNQIAHGMTQTPPLNIQHKPIEEIIAKVSNVSDRSKRSVNFEAALKELLAKSLKGYSVEQGYRVNVELGSFVHTIEIDLVIRSGSKIVGGVEVKWWSYFHENDFKAAIAEGLLWNYATKSPYILIINPGVRVREALESCPIGSILVVHGTNPNTWLNRLHNAIAILTHS